MKLIRYCRKKSVKCKAFDFYEVKTMKFLKRVATHEQRFLVADCESEFPKYCLLIPEQQSSKVKVLKDTKENVLREVLETKYEVSRHEYEVLLYEQFKIDDKIKINNDTLTITRSMIKLKDGILQFTYIIENPNYLGCRPERDKEIAHWFPY